jgi:hypothetical protein
MHREQDDAEGRTSCWAFGMTELTPAARRTLCPWQARPWLFNKSLAAPDRRVIESQSVRLSANFLRPERRSTDGQVILKPTSG